jgi:hypothetical protein
VQTWIEHRRDDGERLGWIRPEGDHFVVIDLLGREDPTPRDWLSAEAALEEKGLAWLSEPWELERDGRVIGVRIVGVSPSGITVKTEDYGAIDMPLTVYHLPFPAPPELRPRRAS